MVQGRVIIRSPSVDLPTIGQDQMPDDFDSAFRSSDVEQVASLYFCFALQQDIPLFVSTLGLQQSLKGRNVVLLKHQQLDGGEVFRHSTTQD